VGRYDEVGEIFEFLGRVSMVFEEIDEELVIVAGNLFVEVCCAKNFS
jgi:hypothetical protein